MSHVHERSAGRYNAFAPCGVQVVAQVGDPDQPDVPPDLEPSATEFDYPNKEVTCRDCLDAIAQRRILDALDRKRADRERDAKLAEQSWQARRGA